MKILLIEDERILAELIRLFLQSQGHTITLASDGQAGIDSYMRSLDSNYLFDLVITDYRMPRKDGGQVVTEIFQVIQEKKSILIMLLALTKRTHQPISLKLLCPVLICNL